jgi:hypothetical protein
MGRVLGVKRTRNDAAEMALMIPISTRWAKAFDANLAAATTSCRGSFRKRGLAVKREPAFAPSEVRLATGAGWRRSSNYSLITILLSLTTLAQRLISFSIKLPKTSGEDNR